MDLRVNHRCTNRKFMGKWLTFWSYRLFGETCFSVGITILESDHGSGDSSLGFSRHVRTFCDACQSGFYAYVINLLTSGYDSIQHFRFYAHDQ
jgi:hypothetical protein